MTKTQEVSRFPRAEGEYIISDAVRLSHVGIAVAEKIGVKFSSLHISDELGKIETSSLKGLLTQRAREFSHPNELINLYSQLQQFGLLHLELLGMTAVWNTDDKQGGVRFRLCITTLGVQTFSVTGQLFAKAIKDASRNLHPFAIKLLGSGGSIYYSWNELGIEPHALVGNLFETFVSDRFEGENQRTVRLLAEHPDLAAFSPNTWWSPFRPCFVPESAQGALVAQWDEQLRKFAASITPK